MKPLAIPMASLYYIQFNIDAQPALKNPALWEAARYLFDYHGIADDLLKGQFGASVLPAGGLPRRAQRDAVSVRPGKAKAIPAKAGLKNVSFKLAVSNQPPYLDIAQALQASFAKGGIRVELIPGLSTEVSTNVKAHKYEATLNARERTISIRTPTPPPSPTTRKTAVKRSPGAPTGTFLN